MNATRQGGALGTLLPGRPDARREQINRVPRRFDEGDARSNGSATRSQRPSFGLLVVSALLLLTAAFGRQFSKLELGGVTWLHPTEVALLAVAIWPVVSGGVQDWIRRLRESGVLVPLLVLWFFGGIATLRGLQDWGFSHVLHDIGLVEYSVLVPLVVLVVRDKRDFVWLCRVIAFGGLLAIAVQAATYWTPLQWELGPRLQLITVASGMYASIYAAWVAAQLASGVRVAHWHYAALLLGVAVTIIGVSRAAWLGLVAACILPVLMGRGRRRLIAAGIVGVILVCGVVVAGPAARIKIGEPPAAPVPTATTEDASSTDGAPTEEGAAQTFAEPAARDASSASEVAQEPSAAPAPEPALVAGGSQVAGEIGASFDPSQPGGTNARWRLDFWTFLVRQAVHSPMLGVGFGKPSNFVWSGIPYDSRTGNPLDPFDVTGPHNSFVNLLYRTGVFGLLAVAVLMGISVFRLVPVAWRLEGRDRALAIWLLAVLAVITIVTALSVALEGPFMGIFFWTVLGMCLLTPAMLVPNRSLRGTG